MKRVIVQGSVYGIVTLVLWAAFNAVFWDSGTSPITAGVVAGSSYVFGGISHDR